jgi:sodium/potassium-transporting ATPase subunit alpha
MMSIALLNAGFEFYEIYNIGKVLDAISDSVTADVLVIRDGDFVKVPSTEIVRGDVFKLTPGLKIPADGILLYDYDLRVDLSSLNGEIHPIEKKALMGGSKIEEAYESMNVIFSHCIVVSGEGIAVATHTGSKALINKIQKLGHTSTKKRSPLAKEIRRFTKINAMIAILFAFVFFIVALIRGKNFNYAVVFAIGIILAWIPQGLPLVVTFILTASGRRMYQKNVAIKDLHGIETLGAITLLATDKTGTLTKNEMSLVQIWINADQFTSDGPKKISSLKPDVPGLTQILHISATCTRARIVKHNENEK